MSLDVASYIEANGIDYRRKGGKNIMPYHIGLNCPICNQDPSYHLNVRLDGGHAKCFICGYRTLNRFVIFKKILTHDRGDYNQFKEALEEFPFDDYVEKYEPEEEKIEDKRGGFEKLWDSFKILKNKAYKEYLNKNRGIKIKYAKKIGIKIGIGKYQWRLMLPVRNMNGEVVSFVGRIIDDNSEYPYLNCPRKKGLEYLPFGIYESLQINKNYLVITEGAFDSLKLLQNKIRSVALLKKKLTKEHREVLLDAFDKDCIIYVCLDSDTKKSEAREIMDSLGIVFKDVKRITFDKKKDLGEIENKDIKKLKKILQQNVRRINAKKKEIKRNSRYRK